MAWEFATEIADHRRLRAQVLSREPSVRPPFESGMRVKTQLVSMAEIIPLDDTDEITEVEALPPIAGAETRILNTSMHTPASVPGPPETTTAPATRLSRAKLPLTALLLLLVALAAAAAVGVGYWAASLAG
jgi:hypothetical protein